MRCNCRECGVVLTQDNWPKFAMKSNYKICKSCKSKSNAKSNPKHNPNNNPTTNANMLYIDGKYISRKDPRYKVYRPGNYKTKDGLLEVSNVGTNKKQGYVYVLVNPHFENWVKIGMAEDVDKRLSQFNTAYPKRDGQMVYTVKVSNMRKAEKKAHTIAGKLAKRTEKEWFTLTVGQATDILNRVGSKVTKQKQEQIKPAIQDLFDYAETGT
tara:strand:+ start:105 stop:740 length:636 start_codon:yes stop_codon:yes gene_type:complete